jgi:hypothetical protein
VRNFDLNLAYFEQAVQWLGDGRLRMSLRKTDAETTARKVRAAVDFFRGKSEESFHDLNVYNDHAGVYTGFGSVLNGLFDNFARKLLLGRPVPALVDRFFEELLGPVKAFEPDLAGFSILFSQQLFFALTLAKLCKGGGGPGKDSIRGHADTHSRVGLDPRVASWVPFPFPSAGTRRKWTAHS